MGRYRCHAALCGNYQFKEGAQRPTIEFVQQDRDHALLKYNDQPVRIATQYLQKLVRETYMVGGLSFSRNKIVMLSIISLLGTIISI